MNGRATRREATKIERVLGVEKAQGPEGKEHSSFGEVGGVEWPKGLERAVGEVILIAKDQVREPRFVRAA